jgi:type II secretory pathway predicted ATPase ExeA
MHERLNQRITLKYHMAGFVDDEEARSFVRNQLKIAGRTDPLFEEPSI